MKEQDKVQSEPAVLLQGARKVGEGQSKDARIMDCRGRFSEEPEESGAERATQPGRAAWN